MRVVFWLLFAVGAVWALIAAATRQFQHRIDDEARALLAAASGSAAMVAAHELEKLPPPVRRWLAVSGTVTEWRTIRGIEMPVRGNALWKLAGGDFDYYRWEILDVEANHPALYADEPAPPEEAAR